MHLRPQHIILIASLLPHLTLIHASSHGGKASQLLRRDADAAAADDLILARDDAGGLTKRTCKYIGCKCYQGTPAGVYCRGCSNAVYESGDLAAYPGTHQSNWAFQCNPTGGCCAYGPRKDCYGGAHGTCG
ncbi:hypothetical protein BZA05DRAFT_459112 [Tricharina praecox]|uniref:uncharacterized protein n=1 Tax=Tricharina praecox TaxID=43433 RepID=UPI00221F2AD3|nr:uncharacterized protein BZA05DRAFT_459112 [Tricharina praecox]KAI5845343.1 hypothetical protein BZA05DRAFT_459112 [Tricharina praecox]